MLISTETLNQVGKVNSTELIQVTYNDYEIDFTLKKVTLVHDYHSVLEADVSCCTQGRPGLFKP